MLILIYHNLGLWSHRGLLTLSPVHCSVCALLKDRSLDRLTTFRPILEVMESTCGIAPDSVNRARDRANDCALL